MEIKNCVIIILGILIGVISIIPFGKEEELKCRSFWRRMVNGIKWLPLKTIATATCAFMALTYMFAFTNGMFLYDASVIYREMNFKPTVLSDKWFSPFLNILDMGVSMPWLAGVWVTIFLILSVYCIVDILDIRKKMSIWLVSGLCATNSAIICQQELIGGNYTGLLALLFACLSAWLAVKGKGRILYIVGSIIFTALSTATYGAYVSVAPCLMIMKVLLDICSGRKAKENWKNSFLYCLEFVLGMLLYYIVLRMEMHFLGLELQAYMGESALADSGVIVEMIARIPEAYKQIGIYYLGGNAAGFLPTYIANIMTIVFVIGIVVSIIYLKKKYIQIVDKKFNLLLKGILVIILPVAVNMIYVVSAGSVHFLMIFTYVMPFLFFVREIEELVDIHTDKGVTFKRLNVVYSTLLCVFIFSSIQLANAIFTSCYEYWVEAQSIGTRVLDRIENCEGFEGTEKVVIIGAMQRDIYYGEPDTDIKILDAKIGEVQSMNVNALNYGSYLRRFLTYILGSNMEYIKYLDIDSCIEAEQLGTEEQRELAEMGYFPRSNSVRKIGDVIYIKFPNDE